MVGADAISIVSGLDRAMFGFFRAKRAAEQCIAPSGLPWTTLRATQFHDLIPTTVRQLTRLPLVPVPAGVRFQPIAVLSLLGTGDRATLEQMLGLLRPRADPARCGCGPRGLLPSRASAVNLRVLWAHSASGLPHR